MRWISALLLFVATPALGQGPLVVYPPGSGSAPVAAVWNPAADYISIGQDELGYRSWYGASQRHSARVKGFNDYLAQWGVSAIVPDLAAAPDRDLVAALRRSAVRGAPESASGRTSSRPFATSTTTSSRPLDRSKPFPPTAILHLNVCAGGAPESAHKHYSAVDLVPLRQTTREELMRKLCAVHARRGTDYSVGLGFYAFMRFHVDTTKYRRWGADPNVASCPPIVRPADIASVGQRNAVADRFGRSQRNCSSRCVAPADPGPKVVFAPPSSPPAPDTQPQQD